MSLGDFEGLLGFTPLKAELLSDLGINPDNCLSDTPVNNPPEPEGDFYEENEGLIEYCDFLTFTQIAAVTYKDIYKKIHTKKIYYIEQIIKEECYKVDPKFKFTICGDYRRQLTWCKDINIVITHTDEVNFTGIPSNLYRVLKRLMKIDFIVEILEGVNKKGTCSVICQLGMSTSFHLINFVYVPPSKYYVAIFLQTGPTLFIEKMIKHARQLGMIIEDNQTQKVFCRGLVKEPPIKCENEEDVFEILCLPYVNPEDRH